MPGRLLSYLQANDLTVGCSTIPRMAATTTASGNLATGVLRFTFFTAPRAFTTTQVRAVSGTAAGATPSLLRLGLYMVGATGAGTLVASTPNDTTLFATGTTAYTKAWSVPYALVASQRYAFATLAVTAASAGTLVGALPLQDAAPGGRNEAGLAPRLSGLLSGQTDLPASFTDAALTASSAMVYAAILP